jgi:hypothetical protein
VFKSLQQAGFLLGLDGLSLPSSAARISFSEGHAIVMDGRFVEAKK